MSNDQANAEHPTEALAASITAARGRRSREQQRAKSQKAAMIRADARTRAALVEAVATSAVDETKAEAGAAKTASDKAWTKFASIQVEAEGVLKALQAEERKAQRRR